MKGKREAYFGGARFGYHRWKKMVRWSSRVLEMGPKRWAIGFRRLVEENCYYWNEGFWAWKWVKEGLILGGGGRIGYHSR